MAVSVDPPEVSEKFRQELGATFTFVSDENEELLDALNVRHREGRRGSDIAFPTAVLVDSYGVVRWVYEAEFGHMRMTPQDLFEAMERLTLEEQNRELLRGRAVSKVVRQVFLMKQPEDLAKAIEVMREELHGLGLSFSVCGIAVVEPDKEKVIAFSASPSLTREELSVSEVPELTHLVEAWKDKRVDLQRFDMRACSQSLCRMAAGSSESSPEVELDWLLNVPFSHGTVFVGGSNGEVPSGDEERTLTEFADAISVAYQRFVDFRELEHSNRMIRETQLQLIQSEKMASLGQLVAGVAHELNTPMGAIYSNIQSAKSALERVRALLDSEHRISGEDLDKLVGTARTLVDMNAVNEKAGRRIIDIVGNLRKFARLDESEWKKVDLRDGLEETLALVRHETKDRIRVTKDYGDMPPVGCYPGQLNQVFMNLIVNAIQAIDGEGTIHIETLLQGDEAVVRVTDSGHGIPEDEQSRIFDPGFTTKGVGVGTGLGLSICYRIVENHGGRLTFESDPGKGSIFTVSLPLDARRDKLVATTAAPYSSARWRP